MRTPSLLILTGVAALALGAAAVATAKPAHGHHACRTWHTASARHFGGVRFSRSERHEGDWRGSDRVLGDHWHDRRADRGPGGPGEHLWADHGWRGSNGLERDWGGRSGHAVFEGERRAFSMEDHAWASNEGVAWGGEAYERHTTVDRFGFLTWPGKVHFHHGPAAAEPEAGPPVEGAGPPPPEEGPPPPPHEEGYEIRRF